MNNDINLISTQDISIGKKKRVKIIRGIAISLLAFTAFVSILTFFLNSQVSLASIKKDQDFVLRSMSFLSSKRAKLDLVNDRVKNISEILSKRQNYLNTIRTILDKLPNGTSPTSLGVESDNILLTISSNSLSSVNKFLNDLIDLSIQGHILKNMTIESLTISKDGGYSLSIKAKLL